MAFNVDRFRQQNDQQQRSRWDTIRDKMATVLDKSRGDLDSRIATGWARDDQRYKQAEQELAEAQFKQGTNWGNDVASGASIGASVGGSFGPVGAGVGGLIGAGIGTVKGLFNAGMAADKYSKKMGRSLDAGDIGQMFAGGIPDASAGGNVAIAAQGLKGLGQGGAPPIESLGRELPPLPGQQLNLTGPTDDPRMGGFGASGQMQPLPPEPGYSAPGMEALGLDQGNPGRSSGVPGGEAADYGGLPPQLPPPPTVPPDLRQNQSSNPYMRTRRY